MHPYISVVQVKSFAFSRQDSGMEAAETFRFTAVLFAPAPADPVLHPHQEHSRLRPLHIQLLLRLVWEDLSGGKRVTHTRLRVASIFRSFFFYFEPFVSPSCLYVSTTSGWQLTPRGFWS